MSPILKRDIGDSIRQARRLAAVATGGRISPDTGRGYSDDEPCRENGKRSSSRTGLGFTSSSDRRMGLGTENGDEEWDKSLEWEEAEVGSRQDHHHGTSGPLGRLEEEEELGERRRRSTQRSRDEVEDWEGRAGEDMAMLTDQHVGRVGGLDFAEAEADHGHGLDGRWCDLRNLLLESTPSLLLSLVGLVFTGELLEHLARWRVFQRVDELFILVPMIGNLKGNLEMCLSARLGTSANIGELDDRRTRRALLMANMTLLGLQALLISSLAALISFVLGLLTVHRLGDIDATAAASAASGADAGLAVGEVDWHEGYTRPGLTQLIMVLATGMGAAGLSSAVLGSFMSSLIVLSRWFGLDPDNITPPLAACLGDLVTLYILALLGTSLVDWMATPLPFIAVVLMSLAGIWFTRRVMRNDWVKNVAKGGWIPLIGAMLISSGTGMVLDHSVGKYRGFALLAISMTGLTGAIGAIHANRLSTTLHTALQPARTFSHEPKPAALSAKESMATLFCLAFPCQACFVFFVSWAGWIDLSLGWVGWVCFALTVRPLLALLLAVREADAQTAVSLALAHALTVYFWSKDLDPDSYTLPIQSALVDFIGQILLVIAYEICIHLGKDVVVHDTPASTAS